MAMSGTRKAILIIGGIFAVLVFVVIIGALAIWMAFRRAPSKSVSALAIDEHYGLRERVVTSVALTDDEAQTAAGQALLADVQAKVAEIRVAEKFPVRLP